MTGQAAEADMMAESFTLAVAAPAERQGEARCGAAVMSSCVAARARGRGSWRANACARQVRVSGVGSNRLGRFSLEGT